MKRIVAYGLLTCLALVAVTDNAQAQLLRGRRMARDNGYNSQAPGYVMMTQDGQGQISQAQGTSGIYSGSPAYTSAGQWQRQQQGSQVLLHIQAAPSARISIQGQQMQQQAGMQPGMPTERLFISPPLDTSIGYVYTVRASWEENGQTMSQERRVSCSPGQQISVSFLDGAQGQQQQQQRGSQPVGRQQIDQ